MATEFRITISSPARKLLETEATEVILPGFDGEVGVLAGHQDFIGLLGTGVLKLVRGGDDYWFMVSGGVFEMKGGVLSVLTEVGEKPDDIDFEGAQARAESLEPELLKKSTYSKDHEGLFVEYQKERARLEVHRRTELVN